MSDAVTVVQSKEPSFLTSEEALRSFVQAWEERRLPKAAWTHAAHVAVAAWYAFEADPTVTFARMRSGIIRFNESVGTSNTETGGYHETLTRFWAGEISGFISQGHFSTRLSAATAAVERFGRSDYFRNFYSHDVVADKQARREWVAPDIVSDRTPACPRNSG